MSIILSIKPRTLPDIIECVTILQIKKISVGLFLESIFEQSARKAEYFFLKITEHITKLYMFWAGLVRVRELLLEQPRDCFSKFQSFTRGKHAGEKIWNETAPPRCDSNLGEACYEALLCEKTKASLSRFCKAEAAGGSPNFLDPDVVMWVFDDSSQDSRIDKARFDEVDSTRIEKWKGSMHDARVQISVPLVLLCVW